MVSSPPEPQPVGSAISTGSSCRIRPTLDDVLASTALPPYTLSAFMAFLSQNKCLEALEFTMDVKRYREAYDSFVGRLGGSAMANDCQKTQNLRALWDCLLTAYILPGSPREINLSSEVRGALLQNCDLPVPPAPETLVPATRCLHDLMEESIFPVFLESHGVSPSIASRSDSPFNVDDAPNLSTIDLDQNSVISVRSRTRAVSPCSSTNFLTPAPSVDYFSQSNLSLSVQIADRLTGVSVSGRSTSEAATNNLTRNAQSNFPAEESMASPIPTLTSELPPPMHSSKLRPKNLWRKLSTKLYHKRR